MDKDLGIYEAALADALDVQLSDGEFTSITKPGVLDRYQIWWNSKYYMWPVFDGGSD